MSASPAHRTAIAALAAVVLALMIAGCAASLPRLTADQQFQRGTLVTVEPLGTLDQQQLQNIASEFPGAISVHHAARLDRVIYWTLLKGTPVRASGLIVTPLGVPSPKGVVIYLHGTNATRALAPSQPDRVDGNEEAAVFGGSGYIVVLPDYIGLGTSVVPHPYLIVAPQVDASLDLLRALRSISTVSAGAPSFNLFMIGFSQGGQVVAGLHRALEQHPLAGYRLRGSVGIAGPYDLRGASLPKAIENQCLQCVGYLAWATYAYADYYGHQLDHALRAPYATTVPELFDGTRTAEEIGGALPEDPAEMFQPQFLAAMRGAGDNWFTHALAENETYAWVPVAPIRLYFGTADVDVSPSASQAFFDFAKPRGGHVTLHPLAEADHQGSAAQAYAPTLEWFDALSREP